MARRHKTKRSYKRIGNFKMDSNIMRVSDPCYDKTVWCSGVIHNCLTGRWDAAVAYSDEGILGRRVAVLAAKHTDFSQSFSQCDQVWADQKYVHFPAEWTVCDFEVGVDSGQAGLFDEAHYQDESIFQGLPEPMVSFGSLWFDHCCEKTMGEDQAGTIRYGAVSSSGFGDGGYTALVHRNESAQADCVMILFLSEETDGGYL